MEAEAELQAIDVDQIDSAIESAISPELAGLINVLLTAALALTLVIAGQIGLVYFWRHVINERYCASRLVLSRGAQALILRLVVAACARLAESVRLAVVWLCGCAELSLLHCTMASCCPC